MVVRAAYHGRGVGRALGEAVLDAARTTGYPVIRLDASIRQAEAQALYRRLGLRETARYSELPEQRRGWLVFVECSLQT